jgi:hypothetical protein
MELVEDEDGLYVGDDLYVEMVSDVRVTPVVCLCIHKGTVWNGSLEGDTELQQVDIETRAEKGYSAYDGPRYGCLHWIHQKIKDIGAAWATDHDYPFEVGQISKLHGGESAGGSSSHQNGLDVDVRYIRTDHRQEAFSFNNGSSGYDQVATQDLVDLFLSQGAILIVGVNDAQLDTGSIHFQHEPNRHHNHFHVRFPPPD